jgi:hypothetical protein
MPPRMIALLAALTAVAAVAGPASATTPPPDYGSRVECRYRSNSPGPAYNWNLKRIKVAPPTMLAKSGTQKVGWRFVVQRSISSGPWKVTYRSPIQKRTATTAVAADFTTKLVDVVVPKTEDGPRAVDYHVTLKMFWYRADGSVQSKVSYLMPTLHWITNGHDYGDYDDYCQGQFYAGP